MSLCGIHLPGPCGIGGDACPACAAMVRMAGEMATVLETRFGAVRAARSANGKPRECAAKEGAVVKKRDEDIASRFLSGTSIEELARYFDVERDEVEAAIRTNLFARDDSAFRERSEEWRRMMRDIVPRDGEHEDESDDPEVLRECLVRTRMGAAAERQCAASRSIVADLKVMPKAEGAPELSRFRFLVSVPTGDLGELRETARHVFAAFFLGARDATALRLAMTGEDEEP